MLAAFAAAPVAAQDMAAACAGLKSDPAHTVKFAQIVDANTTILSAKLVPAGGDGTIIEKDYPEMCEVEGQIAPSVGFLLRMPSKTWNGKMMFGGCGGGCGNYMTDRIDPALVRNYAVVVTDMGHKGEGWAWALGNHGAELDFGFRSTHVTTVAAKEIINTFYGKPSARNYYNGCSTGGRQGMVEAQRFPDDFEGILVGAPVWNQTANNPYFGSWGAVVNIDRATSKPILGAEKLPMIHAAVMKACDEIDGLKDGLLQDPRKCKWEPTEIQCKGGAGSDCLTAAEVDVVRKIYEGGSNKAGKKYFFGMQRGSEMNWAPEWINSDGKPGRALGGPGFVANNMQTYLMTYYPNGPAYSAMDFDYEKDPARLGMKEYIFNAQNPDLRRFRDNGGKIILYNGWNDNSIPPGLGIDYYELATQTMGGEKATKDFFRLFMLPTVNHCGGGDGGSEVDWITHLENWVEKGQAPEQVITYHLAQPPPTIQRPGRAGRSVQTPRHPLPEGSYDRSRPVFPYPDVARYSGRGDSNVAANWQRAKGR